MAADPILYCLERLSDYRDFERLANDVMLGVGYDDLEPIGGSGDRGRDALHRSRLNDQLTVFAYSARMDWERKLLEDCERIAELHKRPDAVVFVSNREISGRKKDDLKGKVNTKFGWDLDLYDCERLRVQLVGPQNPLLVKHPGIFVPPWFERRGGELVVQAIRNLIVIDHVPADYAAATWLYRKLTSLGWSTWCSGHAPLAGEDTDQTIRLLIVQRAIRYLPLFSRHSTRDPGLVARSSLAAAEEGRVIPCWLDDISDVPMDPVLARLQPAPLQTSWSQGLFELERQLTLGGVEKTLNNYLAQALAIQAYQPEPLLIEKPEMLYANIFPVTVPEKIWAYQLADETADLDNELEASWPHFRRGQWIFAFGPPPKRLPKIKGRPHKYGWRKHPQKYRADSIDVVKVLVKRTLFVACRKVGFQWCNERFTFYLDEPAKTRHGYQQVDGSYTNVSFTGHRTVGSGDYKSVVHYQLGPIFKVAVDTQHAVTVMLRFYVRLTNPDGTLIDTYKIPSRRKRVTKSWWNRQWLQRTIGMMQFMAGDGADIDGEIVVGDGNQAVRVRVMPMFWQCPIGIDMTALQRIGDFGEEIARAREKAGDDSDVEIAPND